MKSRGTQRSGFTLLELAIVVTLMVVLAFKGSVLLKTMRSTTSSETETMLLNDEANLLLDRISLALIGSDRDTLIPQFEIPVHASGVNYSVSLGLDENGEVVWDAPESIGLEGVGVVAWKRNPDLDDEQRAVWSNLVRPLLEGEVSNGEDDNGNGLIDEQGLTFVLYRNSVTIRISLGADPNDPDSATRSVETTVTVRNRID